MKTKEVIVLGGGAAGLFAAITCAEENPDCHVTLFERTASLLAKVKVSGGGRCNATHACFDPAQLIGFYPRGGLALRGPFSRFQPRDTVEWFAARGVAMKTEADGRMFPTSDNSQTIIDCLLAEAHNAGVTITTNALVDVLKVAESGTDFVLALRSGETRLAQAVILATGSNPLGWQWAQTLGHTIVPPVPSLFTFTIKDPRLDGLSGLSVPHAVVSLESTPLLQSGPLLITHWGLSGPAVLKLSAWGARLFSELNYQAQIKVNWLGEPSEDMVLRQLRDLRQSQPRKVVSGTNPFPIPNRLWARLTETAGIAGTPWTQVSNDKLLSLQTQLQQGTFKMTGKSPFKEEFVTCGGVKLEEVDFRKMESKKVPGLYFAGEVLDIDAVTGGFNFQNAWTTGWIAGKSAAQPPQTSNPTR